MTLELVRNHDKKEYLYTLKKVSFSDSYRKVSEKDIDKVNSILRDLFQEPRKT